MIAAGRGAAAVVALRAAAARAQGAAADETFTGAEFGPHLELGLGYGF